MPRLIILRGPMGSGKTSVGKYLKEKLPDSAGLDLDLNANDEVISLNEVLGRENVVGELYDGGSHTTNPTWINKFKEKDYNIISVILIAKFETCAYRVAEIRKDNVSRDNVYSHYNKFHENLKSVFKVKAAIPEISIDTDIKDICEIGDEILNHLT